MSTDLRGRIEQGDLHFLDGLVLLGTIASQRWFGGKSRDVLDARVLDAGVVPGEPPLLAFAIVEVRYGLQSHDLYHLPLGFRPDADNWKASIIAATDGWTVYDALADPDARPGDRRPRSPTTRRSTSARQRSSSAAPATSVTASATAPRSGRWARSSRTARS